MSRRKYYRLSGKLMKFWVYSALEIVAIMLGAFLIYYIAIGSSILWAAIALPVVVAGHFFRELLLWPWLFLASVAIATLAYFTLAYFDVPNALYIASMILSGRYFFVAERQIIADAKSKIDG